MINERIFGAPIPDKVRKKLEDRQSLAQNTIKPPNETINPVFPDSDGAAQVDIHSRTPFVRMWTSLKLIDPAIAFTEEAGYVQVTKEELSRLGIVGQNYSGPVDLELANKLLDKIKNTPSLTSGIYSYTNSHGMGVSMKHPRIIKQIYTRRGAEKKFFIAYNEDRDQLDYARQIYVIGNHAYQDSYGEVRTNDSLQASTALDNNAFVYIPKNVNNLPVLGGTKGGPSGAYTDPTRSTIGTNVSSTGQVQTDTQLMGNTQFPQQLKTNPLLKPQAGITSISSETEGTLGVIKKTTVNFVVHNFYDYDRIYNKFFLKPGATVFIDFGWSNITNLYNPEDLIGTGKDLSYKQNQTKILVDIQEKLYNEKDGIVTNEQGDLEVLQGIVTDYSSKILMNGSVECSVTLTSANSALVNFKTDKITNARIHSILKDGILLAGLIPTIDNEGAPIPGTAPTGNEQCTHFNTAVVNGIFTEFDASETPTHGTQIMCENPDKQEFTGQSSKGFWKDPNYIIGVGTPGPDDDDLKELLSFPNSNSSAKDVIEYQKNLRLLAQQQLSSTGPAPTGNSIRTGIFVDNLNADNVYMSWGLFEDLIMNSEFGHGKNLANINGGKDFQVRMDSSTTFTTYSDSLLEKQRVLLSITEEPPKILYPEWWSLADDDLDPIDENGGSYNWQKKKYPVSEFNETYNADLLNKNKGDITDYTKFVKDETYTHKRIPLREVFINVEVIMEAFRQNNTVMKVINSILKKLNNDADGVFNWKMVTGNTDSQFKIVDLHYLSILKKITKKINKTDPTQGFNIISPEDNPLFTFKIMSPQSIVTDYNLEFKLPQGSIGSMYAIQGMSHDTSVVSIDDTMDDVIGLTSLDPDSNVIIYEPDNGKHRIEQLQANSTDGSDFNVYDTISDIVSSDTWNISGVIQQDVLSKPLTSPDPLSTKPTTTTTSGGSTTTPTPEDIIKINDDRLKALGFIVAPTFTKYFEHKIRGDVVESERPNLLPYTLSLKLYGIASIVPGDTFKVDYLPEKHFNHTFLQTIKVRHDIDSTGWYTTLETQYRLLPNVKQTSIKGRNKNRMRLSPLGLKRLPMFKNTDMPFLKNLLPYITNIRISSLKNFDFIMDFTTTDMKPYLDASNNNKWLWQQAADEKLIPGYSIPKVKALGLVTNGGWQDSPSAITGARIAGFKLVHDIDTPGGPGGGGTTIVTPTDLKVHETQYNGVIDGVDGWETEDDGDIQISAWAFVGNQTGSSLIRYQFVPVPVNITQNYHEFRLVYLDGAYMLFDKSMAKYDMIFRFFNNKNLQTWNQNQRLTAYLLKGTTSSGFFAPVI